MKKGVTVFSNDPESPRLTLMLEGEVTAEVMVAPRFLWFGAVAANAKATKDFTITVQDPAKSKITGITVEDKKFKVKQKGEDPKGTLNYELTFLGSKKLDRFTTHMKIEAEGVKKSPIDVTVRVEVVGDLRYTKFIRFNRGKDGFRHRDVMFSSRSGKKVKLKKASDPSGLLKLTVSERGNNAVVRAEVAKSERSYRPPVRRQFKVKTADRNEPEVEIGYSIFEPVPRATRPRTPPVARSSRRAAKPAAPAH